MNYGNKTTFECGYSAECSAIGRKEHNPLKRNKALIRGGESLVPDNNPMKEGTGISFERDLSLK